MMMMMMMMTVMMMMMMMMMMILSVNVVVVERFPIWLSLLEQTNSASAYAEPVRKSSKKPLKYLLLDLAPYTKSTSTKLI